MRTLLDIKTEITEILSARKEELTKRQISRNRNRVAFLNHISMYLENNPDELYLGREIGRIENRMKLIYDQYPGEWSLVDKDTKKKYEQENDIPKLRLQLRVLRFIKK